MSKKQISLFSSLFFFAFVGLEIVMIFWGGVGGGGGGRLFCFVHAHASSS